MTRTDPLSNLEFSMHPTGAAARRPSGTGRHGAARPIGQVVIAAALMATAALFSGPVLSQSTTGASTQCVLAWRVILSLLAAAYVQPSCVQVKGFPAADACVRM